LLVGCVRIAVRPILLLLIAVLVVVRIVVRIRILGLRIRGPIWTVGVVRICVRRRCLSRRRRLLCRWSCRSLRLRLRVLGQHGRSREQRGADQFFHSTFSLSGRDVQNLRLVPLRNPAAVSFRWYLCVFLAPFENGRCHFFSNQPAPPHIRYFVGIISVVRC